MNRGALLGAVGSSMGARLGTAVLNYGLFWVLAHRLGAEALGGFSLLMNVFLLVQTLPLLGLSLPLWRRAAAVPRQRRREVSNALAFAVPVALALGIGLGVYGRWSHAPMLQWPLWLVGAALLPTAWTLIAEASLLGMERVADVARINFAESLARAFFVVLAVQAGFGLAGVFGIFLALRCAAALVYLAHPRVPRPHRRLVSGRLQRRNVAEVPIFLGIAVMAAASGRLDLIVLAHLRGLEEAAVYSAASRLYDATLMVPTITALVVMPTLARQFVSARADFGSTLDVAVRLSLSLGTAAALGVAALADPVVELLYRSEMRGAAPVLRWLGFASVLMVVDTVLSSTMLAAKAQSQDLRALVVSFATLAAGLFTLPIGYGATGAAAAVVLALAVRVAWRLRWAGRTLGLRPWGSVGRLGVSALAGLGGLLLGLRTSPGAALAAALTGYGVAVVASGVWGSRPWAGLRDDIARLAGRASVAGSAHGK